MSIQTPEIATTFGAIDSDAFTDGDLPSAHICREIIRGANRLLCRGEPIINMVWDVGTALHTEVMPSGGCGGFAPPFWTKIVPGPFTRPKPGGLVLAKLHLRVSTRSGEQVFIQTHTSAISFQETLEPSRANTVTISGNGSWQTTTLSNIPMSSDPWDQFGFYLMGTMVAGTYTGGGTPTSGTEFVATSPTTIIYTGGSPAWTMSPNTSAWDRLGTAFTIEDADGDQALPPRMIIGVPSPDNNQITVFPPYSPEEISAINGDTNNLLTFRMRQLPSWRLGNIALYAQDRTV